MKPRFTLALAILTLTAASAVVGPAVTAQDTPASQETETEAKAKPKVVVEEPEIVFGEVPKGAEVSHDFVLRNSGDAPLEITRVAPACGCTVADFDEVIPPGGEGKIHIVVETETLEGPTRRAVRVFTNDPAQPTLSLFFQADVKRFVSAQPGYARYQVVQGEGVPGLIEQTVYSLDGADYEITKVETPFPFLEVSYHRATEEELKEQISTGPQWIVDFHLKYDQAPVGPLTGNVVVHTTHPVQTELHLPVSGFVRPAMWVTPREVELGKVKIEDEPVSFSVVIQNFLSDPMEITRIESDLLGTESSFSPIQEGRKYTVRVTMTPDTPKGQLRGTLVIHTNSDKSPMVEVPITGTVL